MKRYSVLCKKIDPKARDAYTEHAADYLDVNGGEDEIPVGSIVEYSTALDDSGVAAFELASNLIELEEVSEASIDVAEAVEATEAASVPIPHPEDLKFHKADYLRRGKQGRGVTLAVLDTGLGYVVYGWLKDAGILKGSYSTVPGDNSAYNSSNDHGSHVSCLSTTDQVKLLSYQVLSDAGSGSSDAICKAIYDAANRGADVISMSLSGSGAESAYERAISYANRHGAEVICAAGNSGRTEKQYPAACKSAVSVAAFDRTTGAPASFSTDNDEVDIAASGVNVLSYGARGQFMRMSGTSQACPGVSYVICAVMAETGKSSSRVVKYLKRTAKNTRANANHEGHGIMRARRAQNHIERG